MAVPRLSRKSRSRRTVDSDTSSSAAIIGTREAWLAAIEGRGPALLALSRQNLPILERPAGADARQGAYVLRDPAEGTPEVLLIGTGSEVSLALEAADLLEADGGPRTRV